MNPKLVKIIEYMSLAGITVKKDLVRLGKYHATEQYLGGVLSGKYELTPKEEKELYKAINIARAAKLMNYDKLQDANS